MTLLVPGLVRKETPTGKPQTAVELRVPMEQLVDMLLPPGDKLPFNAKVTVETPGTPGSHRDTHAVALGMTELVMRWEQ